MTLDSPEDDAKESLVAVAERWKRMRQWNAVEEREGRRKKHEEEEEENARRKQEKERKAKEASRVVELAMAERRAIEATKAGESEQESAGIEAGPKHTFEQLPSVGTWLMPQKLKQQMTRPCELPEVEVKEVRIFGHIPSVGTWMAAQYPHERQ